MRRWSWIWADSNDEWVYERTWVENKSSHHETNFVFYILNLALLTCTWVICYFFQSRVKLMTMWSLVPSAQSGPTTKRVGAGYVQMVWTFSHLWTALSQVLEGLKAVKLLCQIAVSTMRFTPCTAPAVVTAMAVVPPLNLLKILRQAEAPLDAPPPTSTCPQTVPTVDLHLQESLITSAVKSASLRGLLWRRVRAFFARWTSSDSEGQHYGPVHKVGNHGWS